MIIDTNNPTPPQAKLLLIARLNALARCADIAARKIEDLDLDTVEGQEAFCDALISVQHFSQSWEDAERKLWKSYGLDTIDR